MVLRCGALPRSTVRIRLLLLLLLLLRPLSNNRCDARLRLSDSDALMQRVQSAIPSLVLQCYGLLELLHALLLALASLLANSAQPQRNED